MTTSGSKDVAKKNSSIISIDGIAITVPSVVIDDRSVIVTGRWIKVASIQSEGWLKGKAITNPESFIRKLMASGLKADTFTFSQAPPDTQQRFDYLMDPENIAAAQTKSFAAWWESLPQEARKNVRRAAKRSVEVRLVEFNDQLVSAISRIYNETPIRQGRRFHHYGKDLDSVRRENAGFLDHSDFIGAYFKDELIGFLKLVYLDNAASILQIVSMNSHYDKRPANALIAKAVELCEQKGLSHLIYGNYTYGNNDRSQLTEFKRRNGFERILVPRYYVPLTFKGRLAFSLKLHRGISSFLPGWVLVWWTSLRTRILRAKLLETKPAES